MLDVKEVIVGGMLERYAREELSDEEADQIDQLLVDNLELGEALEKIYIQLEQSGGML